MTALPYWNSTMNMRIPSWFPFGVDYIPVSVNAHHSGILRRIAALSLRLNSEFLCLTSIQSGSAIFACRLSETSSLVAIGSSFDHVVCDGSGRTTSAVLAIRLAADSDSFMKVGPEDVAVAQ